ncbi:MAG: hypothetical protein EXR67_01040 [Dehalococcoidia bacterium]|nr:hypothetical protein [Dehalococcoidia bacterium]
MSAIGEFSLAGLVQNHTLDAHAAALLSAIAARRGNVIVAAMPRQAGKSTLLHAVADLWPPDTQIVQTRGNSERFEWLGKTNPATTGILVNEFSNHLPAYLSGDGGKVAKVFGALTQGYCLGGTLHAPEAEDVLAELAEEPNAVPPLHIGLLHAVVMLTVWAGPRGTIRRVQSVNLVTSANAPNQMPDTHPLVEFDQRRDAWNADTTPEAASRLATRLGVTSKALAEELSAREQVIDILVQQDTVGPEEVRRHFWETFRQGKTATEK